MIRAYQSGDAHKVLVQKAQIQESIYADNFENIYAYTLCDDTAVYAVFGWRMAAPYSAECFALIGQNCRTKLLELVRFLIREIPIIMRQCYICRVTFTVKKNFLAGERLAKLLGFSFVALLPRFFLNDDYQLFERIL